MPPLPPRRTIRDLLIPRDATETARQGQGIGDIEAMRQAVSAAGKEVLANLPYTGDAMAANDFYEAAKRHDKLGMTLAAASMLPLGHMAGGAFKHIAPTVAEKLTPKAVVAAKDIIDAARDLPMDTPSRMARAAEQGFTHNVYHGTGFSGDMAELLPSSRGLYGPGINTTKTPAIASKYAEDSAEYIANRGGQYAPNVLPLMAKVKNPLRVDNSEQYWDVISELLPNRRRGMGLAKPHAEQIADAQEITNALKKAGYDGVIVNDDIVVPLESSQVRSRFAAFNPANVGKPGLMGALAAALGLGAYNAGKNAQEEQ